MNSQWIYLLPHIDIKASRSRIAQCSATFLKAYRFDSPDRRVEDAIRLV
jgi:hypothetical protein